MRWIIDGNNVMGAGADGWWNDKPAAAERLAQHIAEWCRTHEDQVVLFFDGRPVEDVRAKAGGNLQVRFAPRPKRDAADDEIVELVADLHADPGSLGEIQVVTSDKGLVGRLPPGVAVTGAGSYRRNHLGLGR